MKVLILHNNIQKFDSLSAGGLVEYFGEPQPLSKVPPVAPFLASRMSMNAYL